ncbi:MAG: adenosylmethionine decarboxylase [Candidatus Latescibacterota bacterium]
MSTPAGAGTRAGTGALGRHLLVDLYGCDPSLLDDPRGVEEALREAARAAGATVVGAAFHRFSPHGVTGVLLVQESHLAIHTWPERGFAAVDLFTCGQVTDPWRACPCLEQLLRAGRYTAVEVARGQPALLPEATPR